MTERRCRIWRSFALALLPVLLLSAGADGQEFRWFFGMETGFRTSGVAAADFDRDGDLDLAFAVGEHFPMPTIVLRNDGRGNFHELQRLTGRHQKGHAIGAADLNGDGWTDIVLVTEVGDRNVVFLNDRTGHFVQAWSFGTVGDNGRALAIADLDRDGRPDVVVANRGQPNRAFRNTGADGFEPWFDFGASAGATVALEAADLNGDGWTDVVTADWSGESRGIHVWLNDGSGALRGAGSYGLAHESVFAIDLGDLDGDGDMDIAAAVGQRNPETPDAEGFEYDTWQPGGQDHVLLNDGEGRFTTRVDFGAPDDRSERIELADLDSDGDLDIVVGYARGDWYYSYEGPGDEFWFDRLEPGWFGGIFHNYGGRRFNRTSGFDSHTGTPRDILAADVNGDGFPDLVVASGSGQSAAFLNSLGREVGRWSSEGPP